MTKEKAIIELVKLAQKKETVSEAKRILRKWEWEDEEMKDILWKLRRREEQMEEEIGNYRTLIAEEK